jgi:hypothetical protein
MFTETYYCVSAVFEKEMPELTLGGPGAYGSRFCQGSLKVAGKSITAVFWDEAPCPAPGEHMAGHLGRLCQDTGEWTKAVYSFSREPALCGRSHDDALRLADDLAAKIQPGMTRAQVRDALQGYPYIAGEQYFIYPDVGLKIPFDWSNGGYDENKVNGSVKITKVEIARPWLPRPNLPGPPAH